MFIACRSLVAQMDPRQTIIHAFDLEQHAKYEEARSILEPVLSAASLDPGLSGEAWNVMGLAYEDEGDFLSAQHAFEQAIHILENRPDRIADYASVLSNFGRLYINTGQMETALRLRNKSLALYEKNNNHAGIAVTCIDLAGIAIKQKQLHDARKYLERVKKESKLTSELKNDDLAAFSSMQGWLAEVDDDFSEAASRYRHALDLWREAFGEDNPSTAWGFLLEGKVRAEAGDTSAGLAEMQKGLGILDRLLGRQNPRYLTAAIAYSRILGQTGAHAEAARMKAEAEQELNNWRQRECIDCTISAAAFR